ncbi:MAG: Ig-like domain-containing protein, partial [Chloroflexota bacterium]
MPPHPRLRSPRQILRFVRIATLLALLLSNLAPALPSASAIERAQAAPDLSVSMVDALLDDRDGDGQADAGETVRYTLEIANQGTADALDVGVTVDLDPNTSLVPGSERVSPLALPDSYTALRDTPRTVPAPGVLANDSGLPAPTVVPASGPTAAGGTVSIAADGSFTYTPPAGFTGTDSFSYTATNELGSDTASVTISAEGAPRITGTTPADGAVEVPANSSITIVFDEPVNLDAQAITLGCPAPQPFTISPAAPASTFTIDPTGDLPASATCTVTITAALVTDADTLDPPDTLAADYTFSFTTTDAAPAVTSTTPANGATNVALDVTLTVEFSESVNVSASSFALSCGGPSLDYTLSATTGTSFTLDPADDLPPGTMCSVTVVASEVSDTDAVDPPDTMAADYAFSFMTDAAPEVTSTTPANGATGVAVDANLVVEFSESVNVSASSFVLSCGGPSLDYTLSATTGTSFTLDPADDLPPTSNCTLTIVAAQIADTDPGDPPDVPIADTVVTFTTADPAPTVTSTTPANGATDVAVDANITVTFSESVSVSTSAFALSCGG